MTKMSFISLAALAAILAAAFAPGALAATNVGISATVRNTVDIKTSTDKELRPVVVREPVHLGDAVVSSSQSSMQILLLDHSVFTIGADAHITIDRFVYDPDRGTSDIALSVTKGAFRFMSGRLVGNAGQGAIRTPIGTIGVRGTIVQGAVGPDVRNILAGEPGIPPFTGDPSTDVLVLLDGPGRYAQGLDKPGRIDVAGDTSPSTFFCHPGAAMLLVAGRKPYGPFDLSDAAYARLQALLSKTPNSNDQDIDVGSAAVGSGDILNIGDPGGADLPDQQNLELPFLAGKPIKK